MPTPAKLFDTHCHLFETGFEGPNGVRMPAHDEELDAYQRFRRSAGIEHSLVVGYDEGGYAGNSGYLGTLAATREWLSPLRFTPNGGEVATRASAYPGDPKHAEQLAAQLIAQASAGRAPSIVSLNAPPAAVAALTPAIRQLENTWFLIAHLGLPGPITNPAEVRDRLAPVLSLAGTANVTVKLSGQYAATTGGHPHTDVQPIVDTLAEVLGINALVWGSDFSPCLDFITFDQAVDCVLPAGVTTEEAHAIYFQNAHQNFELFAGANA
ncbi:amidohydrolase family protein [Ruania zhangjianzhongii]|uniref:amidohydrolase family protein n=1 Tax=Ruania zhangjianzhongii TaxID=2603206 RepID=UPI00143D9C09|nr:amidohydrolase family protein [Ruania zhangjianzhongii]